MRRWQSPLNMWKGVLFAEEKSQHQSVEMIQGALKNDCGSFGKKKLLLIFRWTLALRPPNRGSGQGLPSRAWELLFLLTGLLLQGCSLDHQDHLDPSLDQANPIQGRSEKPSTWMKILMITRFNISEPNMAQYKSSPVGYRHTINHENSSQVIYHHHEHD